VSRAAWLASFPKSGNTWARAWLDALQNSAPPDLNQLGRFSTHDRMDSSLDLSVGDLNTAQTLAMTRLSWSMAHPIDTPYVLRKIHHAWVNGPDGYPIPWQPEGARAIYIVRDPRAVAVSLAHHSGVSVEKAVDSMAYDIRPDVWAQLRSGYVLSDWSTHVRSWTSQTDIPMIVVAYESMISQPVVELTRIATFLGFDRSPSEIQAAIDECAFTTLSTREIFEGFVEAPENRAFFRRGEIDSWRHELSPELAARISADHGEIMEEFGYER
jgi:aryl sulfotransferase